MLGWESRAPVKVYGRPLKQCQDVGDIAKLFPAPRMLSRGYVSSSVISSECT